MNPSPNQTKTDPITFEHIKGEGNYGTCKEKHCPNLGNCLVLQEADEKLKPCRFPFTTSDGKTFYKCTGD